MLTAGALFFFCLTLIAKVEVGPSVTHIIIACRPNGTVATEVPSVATCFSLAIFASHFTPPSNSRDNDYSTIPVNVNTLLSNRRWWGRIRWWLDRPQIEVLK